MSLLKSISTLSLLVICLVLMSSNNGGTEYDDIIHSKQVDDQFEIYIDLPEGFSEDKEYAFAFYMDANLNMGKELRRQITLPEHRENLNHVIFVGVGHIGSYRKRRRRDFIPPKFIDGKYAPGENAYFGQAHRFHQFLKAELIPYINERYNGNGRNSLIGHSFSGLFAFYCLFQGDDLFENHIALSPSLWTNYNNIFDAEAHFSKSGKSINAYLYHACGDKEWSNKVLSTSRKMKETLNQRGYNGLRYKYVEHDGKGHNDMVPLSLEYILRQIQF